MRSVRKPNSASMGNAVPQDKNKAVNETVLINLLKDLNSLCISQKYHTEVIKMD